MAEGPKQPISPKRPPRDPRRGTDAADKPEEAIQETRRPLSRGVVEADKPEKTFQEIPCSRLLPQKPHSRLWGGYRPHPDTSRHPLKVVGGYRPPPDPRVKVIGGCRRPRSPVQDCGERQFPTPRSRLWGATAPRTSRWQDIKDMTEK